MMTMLGPLLFINAYALKPEPIQVKPLIPLASSSEILFDMEGRIFQKDHFPESCKDFLQGGKCPNEAFGKFHVQSKKDGELVYSKATFSDPDGIQVVEEAWEKGGHVQRAVVENRALQKKSELEVKSGKVFYKVTDLKNGSVNSSEDGEVPENLVVPGTLMSYIRPHQKELVEGKEIKVKIAVLDRRESYTFEIKKISEGKTVTGEDLMTLQMKPTSFIVRAIVDPIYFYVNKSNGQMFAFEGRSALRRKDGEKYKEFVSRVAYQVNVNKFDQNAVTSTSASQCSSNLILNGTLKCEVKE